MKQTILVTGAVGFIGFHLCKRLIEENKDVIGIDNINPYYEEDLKRARLKELNNLSGNFYFYQNDIENNSEIQKIFEKHNPKKVFNLAAQAGVRYSIDNPRIFIKTNILGFLNILEACKTFAVEHLIYASSSSVYGGNTQLPYFEDNPVDHPVSIYAASKKANESMAHVYSHLYSVPCTGLRFFTVYGPWGRPDMAYFLFTKAILEEKSINVFNQGNMDRDFTYIDDIIVSLIKIMQKPPKKDLTFDRFSPKIHSSWAPHKIFNIGNSTQVPLIEFIEIIEKAIGKKAIKNFMPMQLGDVQSTKADTSLLEDWIGYVPSTPLEEGIHKFVDWYKDYYRK